MSPITYRQLKRVADLAVALPAAVVAAPVAAAIAVAIVATDGRPVLYRQTRVGRDGVDFPMWKFRSMRVDPDAPPAGGIDTTGWDDGVPDDFRFKTSATAAARITPVGRFLRVTSLDELPQVLNILNGTMSWVGPRPEIPLIARRYNARQRRRLEVQPGVTGLAQVSGRSEQSHGEKIDDDLRYVDGVSARMDLGIVWRTIAVVLSGRGAV